MRKLTVFSLVVLLAAVAAQSRAQDAPGIPEMPQPTKEHMWLQQLAGEWESESEVNLPGQPPMKGTGTETARMLGGFWLVAEGEATMMGMPMKCILTLGYDPLRQKFVGSWVDSCTGYFWTYEGTLDDSGKILTLRTRGPHPMKPDELVDVREVLEIKDKDHKVFTSAMQDEDGNWQVMATVNSRRKK